MFLIFLCAVNNVTWTAEISGTIGTMQKGESPFDKAPHAEVTHRLKVSPQLNSIYA